MNKCVKIKDLFSTKNEYIKPFLEEFEYPWQVIPKLNEYINLLFGKGIKGYFFMDDDVLMGENVKICPTAIIKGPAIIGANTEILPGAYINGNVIIGEGCVIGTSTHINNCILCDGVQLPHCNYVSKSILGENSRMGATSICCEFETKVPDFSVLNNDALTSHKIGGILADNVNVGFSCILNPGTIVGKGTTAYPLTLLDGFYPENTTITNENIIHKSDT